MTVGRRHYQRLARLNRARNIREIRDGRTILESRPPFLNIDMMGVCDMRPICRMCTLDITEQRAHRGTSPEQLAGLGSFLDACDQITNCSVGEPLIHPQLEGFLRIAHDRGKVLCLVSNGLSLNEGMASLLMRYRRAVCMIFSLDAATPGTYSLIRCSEHERVCRNILRFSRMRRRHLLGRFPRIGLCFVPMRCNRHELPAFFELARRLGADFVEVRPMIDFPANKRVHHGGFVFDYDEQMLDDAELASCRIEAEAAARRTGVAALWQHDLSQEHPYFLFRPPELRAHPVRCTMPWRFFLGYENGDTVACCYMTRSLGDWRSEGMEAIWNGPKLQRIRAALLAGDLADECLKSPSCPVAQEAWGRFASGRIEAAREALATGGSVVVGAGDALLARLVRDGVYGEEGDAEPYRWLADDARLAIPELWGAGDLQIALEVSTSKPDVGDHPTTCTLALGEQTIGSATLSSWDWTTLAGDLPRHGPGGAELRVRCEGGWVPAERGFNRDTRHLGVMLRALTLRRRAGQTVAATPEPSLALP